MEDGPSWSDIAGWYDELLTSGSGAHETALACLLGLTPPLEGATVLDVACGQGLATRALAQAGATVTGTDLSPAMIGLARGHGAPDGGTVAYVVDDGQRLPSFADGTFEGVTCQLGLMDIPDLDATLSAISRVLVPAGWFAFVIGHPCFLVPDARTTSTPDGRPAVTVTDYFDERFWRSANPCGVRRAGNHHRTIATYLNALVRHGLHLEAVDEPHPSALLAAQQALYAHVPIFLGCRARRL